MAEFYGPALMGLIAGMVESLPDEVKMQLVMKMKEAGYG